MSHQPGTIYIPPFENVRLVECRDFMALVPVCAYREFVGFGKTTVRDFPAEGKSGLLGRLFSLFKGGTKFGWLFRGNDSRTDMRRRD